MRDRVYMTKYQGKTNEVYRYVENAWFSIVGLCVIINNKEFYQIMNDPRSKHLPVREGTEIDCGK